MAFDATKMAVDGDAEAVIDKILNARPTVKYAFPKLSQVEIVKLVI